MTETAEELYVQALNLSPAERAALVEELLRSLDATDPDLDKLWASEAQDRMKAYRAGEIQAYTADEVFSELSID